jgi:hypothetical protein
MKEFKPSREVRFIGIGMTGDGLVGVPVATCRRCGCRDDRACPGGCSWAQVDRKKRTGVCTTCVKKTR